jgi:dTDP-glucose 4,6-dehydratase
LNKIVISGGAGFIGSNFVRLAMESGNYDSVCVLDALTYAGNPANFAQFNNSPNFSFIHGSICDPESVAHAADGADALINFAAETHVDRSIVDPSAFIQTDIAGVHVLMEYQRKVNPKMRIVHVSTDEVYGSIETGSFTEDSPLQPNSPYSASKAGGELMIRAYHVTYGSDVVVTRGSNTFGPRQYPEKLMPLFISNLIDGKQVPVYGDGKQVRDWLYVDDHCRGIETALLHGKAGEAYNIGGGNERENIEITHKLLTKLGKGEEMIKHVEDRPGHDWRYSIGTSKLRALGYKPLHSFDEDFETTVQWYVDNQDWWRAIRDSESYTSFAKNWYAKR